MWYSNWGHHGSGWSMGGGLLGMVLNLLIIISLVYLATRLFKHFRARPKVNGYSSDHLQILKRRFANSEIDEEEFEKLRKNLEA
jgi:uncharacterized membrane protein